MDGESKGPGGVFGSGGREEGPPGAACPPATLGTPTAGPSRRRGTSRRAAALAAVGLAAAALAVGLVSGGRLIGARAGEPPAYFGRAVGSVAAPAITRASGIATVDRGLVDIASSFRLAGARGAATGMVIDARGLVLTNNHVIDGASAITATSVSSGKTYTATVLGYDRHRDVAVLQLRGASGLPVVPLGSSSALAVGARVAAVGNAHGSGGTPKVARGVVTGLDSAIVAGDAGGAHLERLTGMIRTDAGIVPGDSGGPLVNASGLVVGMSTASSAGTGPPQRAVTGFAIPIDTAMSVARAIVAGRGGGGVHVGPTAFLGVAVVPHPARAGAGGAVIGAVIPGYPAAGAGLARGDVIVSVGGRRVASAAVLADVLDRYRPGDVVLVAWRDVSGRAHSVTVTLASGPPA